MSLPIDDLVENESEELESSVTESYLRLSWKIIKWLQLRIRGFMFSNEQDDEV